MAQGTLSLATPPCVPVREPGLDAIRDVVAADIWTRYHRLGGRAARWVQVVVDQDAEVHIEATRRGLTPQRLADEWLERWRSRLDALAVDGGELLRTSETRSRRVARALFLKLLDQEDIARRVRPPNASATAGLSRPGGTTEGTARSGKPTVARDPSCATAGLSSRALEGVTVGQADRGTEDGGYCGAHLDGAAEGYFLRVSKYEKALTRHLADHPALVLPAAGREAVARSAAGSDPWVSRVRGEGGLAVPTDKAQAIEGWFDGLAGHLAASEYLADPEAFERAWPPTLQIVAPDGLATQATAWLALLMAMGLPPPDRLVVRGGLIWHDEAAVPEAGALGAEPLRYAVARAADFTSDGSLSLRGIADVWNAEVVGLLVRLVERSRAGAESACAGRVPRPSAFGAAEEALAGAAAGLLAELDPLVARLDLRAALGAVLALAARAADYVAEQGIGEQPRDARGAQRLATSLYVLLEACRLMAHALSPFLPAVAAAILGRLGLAEEASVPSNRAQWGLTRPLTRLPQGPRLEEQFSL